VQEEHRRFILVRAEKCPTSSGRGEFCIILHRRACSRGYKRVREGGAPKSEGVSGVCVCVTLLMPSQGPGELYVCVSILLSLGMVHAFSFYSLKEVRGYKMLIRGVTLVGEGAQRPQEGLIRWRRDLHCRGMMLVLLALLQHVQACAPLLREWFMSFGVVVTRPVIPGPMDGVAIACSSL
jgi:hypothetical protein